jgi:pentose-5-phosphate-3-epimerase
MIDNDQSYVLDIDKMTLTEVTPATGGKRRRKMTHKRLHKTRRKQKNRKTGTRKKRRSLRKTRQTRG